MFAVVYLLSPPLIRGVGTRLATLWIAFIAIVFMLPQVNPVTSGTLNYAVVAVAIVVICALAFLYLSARYWIWIDDDQIDQIGGFFSLLLGFVRPGLLTRVVLLCRFE